MSGRNPLEGVWAVADTSESRFSADEVALWPDGYECQLIDAGVIRRYDNATTVVCDACHEGHVEEVVSIVSPAGTPPRAYIYCPEAGRVRVPHERLMQWMVDFAGLASAVVRAISLPGETEEIVPGRIWYLGKATMGGKSPDLFLARGLKWADAPRVVGGCERLKVTRAAIVFVPGDVPPGDIWTGEPPFVVSFRMVARLDGHQLVLDRDHLESITASQLVGLAGHYPKDMRIFQNQGKTWFLVYDGVPKSVGDSKGMAYIAHLLQMPGQEIHASDLRNAVSGAENVFLGSGGDILDKQALTEYRERLQDIANELREAEENHDLARSGILKEEMEALTVEIGRATGLRGRNRQAANDRERARQSISVAIHRALKAIKDVHPSLWQHLSPFLNITAFLSYSPDQPISWTT